MVFGATAAHQTYSPNLARELAETCSDFGLEELVNIEGTLI